MYGVLISILSLSLSLSLSTYSRVLVYTYRVRDNPSLGQHDHPDACMYVWMYCVYFLLPLAPRAQTEYGAELRMSIRQ